MRETHRIQPTLTEPWLDVPHAKELKAVSDLLDDHPMIGEKVAQDIGHQGGRPGMTGDQVFRVLVLKQLNEFSYDELAFHLVDSQTYRRFCGFGLTDVIPKRSTLAENLKRVKADTLEAIARQILVVAAKLGVEKARKIRVDSTVVETNIHEPSDSALLWDCVRTLVRLMKQAVELGVANLVFADRTRRAKRRAHEVRRAKGEQQRQRLYKDLLAVTEEVLTTAQAIAVVIAQHPMSDLITAAKLSAIAADIDRFSALTSKVIHQTRRRVLNKEVVPPQEKIVSIFEEHTDIIVKAPREVEFGHKVFLTGGASSLILDCVIAGGNPADSSMAAEMVNRQAEIFGRSPRQAAFDGGFASKENVTVIKEAGVKDVVFHKRRGIQVAAMAKSRWVFTRLRDFRAGIEGCISFLKRAFGLSRCTWRSLPSFKTYVWSSIVSMNLLVIARKLVQ
jgi:IS5 family transposase